MRVTAKKRSQAYPASEEREKGKGDGPANEQESGANEGSGE